MAITYKDNFFFDTTLYYSSSFFRRTSSFIGKYLGSKGLKTAIFYLYLGHFGK